EIHENCFSNFCEFWLISEGVASAPTVYSFLKHETKVFLTFVPRSMMNEPEKSSGGCHGSFFLF
ncbi:MAG: hypothetical protein E6783_10485, partial [Enterococcus durans]|nr:hypothetical protein [Enterococcus durans]